MRTAIIQEKGPARGNNADFLAPIPDASYGALFVCLWLAQMA
jgi:hypothetical protein